MIHRTGELMCVKILCEKSLIQINSPGERARTPLHHAIVNNKIAVVHFLIKSGASVNKR